MNVKRLWLNSMCWKLLVSLPSASSLKALSFYGGGQWSTILGPLIILILTLKIDKEMIVDEEAKWAWANEKSGVEGGDEGEGPEEVPVNPPVDPTVDLTANPTVDFVIDPVI